MGDTANEFEKTLKRMLEAPPKENKPLNKERDEKKMLGAIASALRITIWIDERRYGAPLKDLVDLG